MSGNTQKFLADHPLTKDIDSHHTALHRALSSMATSTASLYAAENILYSLLGEKIAELNGDNKERYSAQKFMRDYAVYKEKTGLIEAIDALKEKIEPYCVGIAPKVSEVSVEL